MGSRANLFYGRHSGLFGGEPRSEDGLYRRKYGPIPVELWPGRFSHPPASRWDAIRGPLPFSVEEKKSPKSKMAQAVEQMASTLVLVVEQIPRGEI